MGYFAALAKQHEDEDLGEEAVVAETGGGGSFVDCGAEDCYTSYVAVVGAADYIAVVGECAHHAFAAEVVGFQ